MKTKLTKITVITTFLVVALVSAVIWCRQLTIIALWTMLISFQAADGLLCFCCKDLAARQFDRTEWLNAEGRCGGFLACERLRMIKDFLAHHELKGMSKQELQSLLGPGYEGVWAKGGFYGENSVNYCLGIVAPWKGEDPWWLCVEIEKGKVVAYTLWSQD